MPVDQSFDDIWIGSSKKGWTGYGIIVDSLHILTCCHVVYEALGRPAKGGLDDDLRDLDSPEPILARTANGEIGLEVVANRPLPLFGEGKREFDDLCILKRGDGGQFPEAAVGRLLARPVGASSDERFYGQGLTATIGDDCEYLSKLFEGHLKAKAHEKHWHYVDFSSEHLAGQKGCSGSAAISNHDRRRGGVLGMMQGGMEDQVGFMIPAWHFADYLRANGIEPKWWEDREPVAERPTKFKAIRKARPLGITEEHLDDCDRRPQIEIFNPANEAFFASGDRLFLALVMGKAHDLPELLDKRLARESIDGFLTHWEYVLEKSVSKGMKGRFPWITIKLRETDSATTVEDVYRLIADRNFSDGSLGRLIGNPKAIAGKFNEVDAPTVITVWFQPQIVQAAAMQSWRDALNRIAEFRRDLPIFVFFFAHPSPELGELNGVVPLGELEPIERSDIDEWIAGRLRTDPDLKWSSESERELLSRLKSDSFRMRELQDWISN